MSEEIKFENPTDLLEKVISHGGKVFEPLYYWQRFDPDNNIRILEEVIEYVERYNQKVFEISGEGLTNIPDSADIFTLPRNLNLNAESVSWFFETTLEDLNMDIEWNRTLRAFKDSHERAGSKAYGAVKKEALEKLGEVCVDMWERSPAYNQFHRILNEFKAIGKITPWDIGDSPFATNTSSIWCLPFAEYKRLRKLQRELENFLDSAKQGFDEIIYGPPKVRGDYIKLEQ